MNPGNNNEAARLRELLERIYLHFQTAEHAEWCCMTIQTPCDCGIGNLCREIKAEITPAPEEAVIKESLTTEPAPEWRELSPDEEICKGDEKFVGRGPWLTQAMYIGKNAGKYPFIRFRTRRPLPDPVPTQPPTQNEWRELGKDEVIQMDDMYRSDVSSRNYPVTSVMIGKPAGNFPFPEYSFRTRRPLPDPVPTQQPHETEMSGWQGL
jgi:hypothetical protein